MIRVKISFKWKLAAALIGVGLFLVLNYALVTRQIYENDKVESIFENQKAQLLSLKKNLTHEFERALLASRGIIASFDPAKGALSSSGQQIFFEEKTLLGLELWNENADRILFRVEKVPGLLPPVGNDEKQMSPDRMHVSPLNNQNFLAFLRYSPKETAYPLRLRAVFNAENFIPGSTSTMLLVYKNQLIAATGPQDISMEDLQLISQGQQPDHLLITKSTLSDFPDFEIYAANPRTAIATQNNVLSKRSLVFIGFAVFVMLALSLTISRNFERHISRKKEEGRAELQDKISLLAEQKLFPAQQNFKINDIEISSENKRGEEYHGNWWHYFTQGDEITLVIANCAEDSPRAAMLAAASKAFFARAEAELWDLPQILQLWKQTLSPLSDEDHPYKMILVRLNTKTSQGQYLCSHHNPPFILHEKEQGYYFNQQEFSQKTEQKKFSLLPNSSLILYTDGIFKDTKQADDIGNLFSGKAEFYRSSQHFTQALMKAYQNDLLLVQLRRQGPERQTFLATVSGDLHQETKEL